MDTAIGLVVIVACSLIGYLIGMNPKVQRAAGIKPAQLSRAGRTRVNIGVVLMVTFCTIAALALVNHDTALFFAMVACLIVPEFVLIPLQIRRARLKRRKRPGA